MSNFMKVKHPIEYSEDRDKELLSVFLEYLGKHSVDDAVRIAVTHPCSRYWISPENAFKRISAFRRGKVYLRNGVAVKPRGSRLRSIISIMERCKGDYSQRKIESIVYSPAPEFYLSVKTAKRYISRALKKRRECRQKD